MTEIESKWLTFAKKYVSMSPRERAMVEKKLSMDQLNYLQKLVKNLEKSNIPSSSTFNRDIHNLSGMTLSVNSSSTQKPIVISSNKTNLKVDPLKEETKESNVGINLHNITHTNSNKFSLNIPQTKPNNIPNSQNSVPSRKLDMSVMMGNDSNKFTHSNLTKSEYLKNKKKSATKSSLIQGLLVAVVLTLPIGSVVFALNNSSKIGVASNGLRSISHVLAENSAQNPKQLEADFVSWIQQYGDISDDQKTKDSDPDSDGLTNIEEMSFDTIPSNDRTCNSTRLDGENIIAGIDPKTCKPVNFNDPNTSAKFDGVVSRTVINQRLSVIGLNRHRIKHPAISIEERVAKLDIDYSKNAKLILLTVNPDLSEIKEVELIWTQLEGTKDLVKKMENNVVLYPDLGIFGESGLNYISGKHTDKNIINSDNDLFAKLDQLTPKDSFKLSLETKDGKTRNFYYKVKNQNLVLASDPKQFTSSSLKSSEIVLSTPWPAMSPEHQMIIRAVLDRVE